MHAHAHTRTHTLFKAEFSDKDPGTLWSPDRSASVSIDAIIKGGKAGVPCLFSPVSPPGLDPAGLSPAPSGRPVRFAATHVSLAPLPHRRLLRSQAGGGGAVHRLLPVLTVYRGPGRIVLSCPLEVRLTIVLDLDKDLEMGGLTSLGA